MGFERCDRTRHPVAHLHGEGERAERFVRTPSEEGVGRNGGQALRFGVVTGFPERDPASRSLLRACARLGSAEALAPSRIRVEVGEGLVRLHFGDAPAEEFDVFLLLRGLGPGGDSELQLLAYRLLEEGGMLVLNSLDALLSAQDKLRTSAILSRAGIPTPPVAAIQRGGDLPAAFERLGTPTVLKPQWGSLGEGVEIVADDRAGARRVEALLDRGGSIYLQGFVDHGGRDLRIFVVGGKVEAAMERHAPPGEFRTNWQVGGSAEEVEVDERLSSIAIGAADALGLDWAGVDIAIGPEGPTVIEVNGSPGWEGIGQTTKKDMGEAIALHAARRSSESARSMARLEGG